MIWPFARRRKHSGDSTPNQPPPQLDQAAQHPSRYSETDRDIAVAILKRARKKSLGVEPYAEFIVKMTNEERARCDSLPDVFLYITEFVGEFDETLMPEWAQHRKFAFTLYPTHSPPANVEP